MAKKPEQPYDGFSPKSKKERASDLEEHRALDVELHSGHRGLLYVHKSWFESENIPFTAEFETWKDKCMLREALETYFEGGQRRAAVTLNVEIYPDGGKMVHFGEVQYTEGA